MTRSTATRELREGTLDLHREAERHVRILDDDATPQTYARFLARMFGFHAAIEDRFAADTELAAIGFAAKARRKQDLLAADLRALGIDAALLERCAALPRLDSRARTLGAAYVVEGSTLGGAFVRSRLAPALATTTQFLTGYGPRTGEMWKAFVALADAQLANAATRADAVAGARDTFTCLITWLDEPGREPPRPFRGFARELQP